ncbi:MAG TPA: histidine kinase dimerization/phosphoacceptor domain -containing protein, partial [Azospirillum sp.]|nr:histidine kinase dimerization/phosphoacceptor domain -containing protein [Azospirillum sp.]
MSIAALPGFARFPGPGFLVAMPLRTLRSHPSPLYRLPGTALVLIACTLAVLLTTALLAAFAWRDRSATVERVATIATTAGMLVAEHAARLVETSDLILRRAVELAGPPGAPLPADRATWERLAELARSTPYVTALWLGDARGNAVLSTHDFPTPRLNAADRDYFQAHAAGDAGLFLGRLDSSRYDNAPAVVLSRALRNADGSLRGFATVTVSPRYFRELYRGIDVGFPTVVSLMRADGTVLLREPAEGAGSGEAVTAQRTIERFGLRTEVAIGHDDALMPWREQVDTYISYGVLALLIVAGMGALALQRAKREREAENALQRAYDTLEERVHQRTAELQDANARLEGAVADKEILLKEVQHRVKNNLTVICSLLRLQAGRLDERARFAFDESLRRIQSMSLVHEL